MDTHKVYLNELGKEQFKDLKIGIVNFVTVYRELGHDILCIAAGSGKFKTTVEELTSWTDHNRIAPEYSFEKETASNPYSQSHLVY